MSNESNVPHRTAALAAGLSQLKSLIAALPGRLAANFTRARRREARA